MNASIRQLKLRGFFSCGRSDWVFFFFPREVCLDLAPNPVRTRAASFEVRR